MVTKVLADITDITHDQVQWGKKENESLGYSIICSMAHSICKIHRNNINPWYSIILQRICDVSDFSFIVLNET